MQISTCIALVRTKGKMLNIYICFIFTFYSDSLLVVKIKAIKAGSFSLWEIIFGLFVISVYTYTPPTLYLGGMPSFKDQDDT